MPIQKLTNEIIAAAILGFAEQKRHIDTQIAELRAMQTGASAGTAGRGGTGTAKALAPQDECRRQEGDCRRPAKEMGGFQKDGGARVSPESGFEAEAETLGCWVEERSSPPPRNVGRRSQPKVRGRRRSLILCGAACNPPDSWLPITPDKAALLV
jgi:hypothetical protein